MKKFGFILSAAVLLVSTTLVAQKRVDGTKTITTADTIILKAVPSKVVGLQATYVETSGTSAGKFYIEGTIDGRAWVHIDSSKSLSDVTTAQTVVVAVTVTTYRDYRVRCSNTSSATGTLYFNALIRSDEMPMPAPLPMAIKKYLPIPALIPIVEGKYITMQKPKLIAESKYIPPSFNKSGDVGKYGIFGRQVAA